MLAKVAAHFGLGQVVAIDPHNFNLPEKTEAAPETLARPASTKDDFLNSLRTADVLEHVEFHHALSKDADALNAFSRPIRVFVEQMLRSNQFGTAGFVHSIA